VDYDAEMNAHALFTMPNRAIVHFEATCSPYSRAGLRQDGWDEIIQINGKKGRIEVFYCIWDKPMNNAPIVRLYKESDKTHTDYTFPKLDAFKEEVKAFINNCQTGKKSIPGIQEGAAVDKLISACYKSAESGGVVEMR
jgi:predicted dehydrogenase